MFRFLVSAAAYSSARSISVLAESEDVALNKFLTAFPEVARDGWSLTAGGFWSVVITDVDRVRPDLVKFWTSDGETVSLN